MSASKVIEKLHAAIQEEIDAGVDQAVKSGAVKLYGLTAEQIDALRRRFIKDVGLLPEEMTAEQIKGGLGDD